MALPTFNITYQDVYTSEIEFKTEVIERQQGEEQRYPVWTYPKRTFTLKFDKTPDGRQAIEDFFIDVMTNYGGQFLYTWDVAKGGNGQTYKCWFDIDTLEMSMKDLGFCETSLKFITIDDTPMTPVSSLDFYHKAEANYSVAFNVIKDKLLNASYKLRQLWQKPRRSWTLTFQKDPKTRKKIEQFFISKRGKFRYFQWVWKEEYGGDGKTYNVRFDEDKLYMDVDYYGYSEFQIKLKEVIPNPSPIAEYEKDELIPRKLLNIELSGGGIHVLDNETLQILSFEGVDYIGAPLEHGEITKDDNSSVAKLEITVSNVGLGISGIIGNRGNVIGNAPATLTMVLLNVNNNAIIQDTKQVLWYGLCNNLQITNESAKMDIETPLGGYTYNTPCMKYKATCNVRKFKDCRCGYTGDETSCDRTYTRCKELGNNKRFQGFISLPAETVIKV